MSCSKFRISMGSEFGSKLKPASLDSVLVDWLVHLAQRTVSQKAKSMKILTSVIHRAGLGTSESCTVRHHSECVVILSEWLYIDQVFCVQNQFWLFTNMGIETRTWKAESKKYVLQKFFEFSCKTFRSYKGNHTQETAVSSRKWRYSVSF